MHMNTKPISKKTKLLSNGIAIASLVFSLCLAALPARAAQNDANQAPPPDPQSQGAPPQAGPPQGNPPQGNPGQPPQNYPSPQEQGAPGVGPVQTAPDQQGPGPNNQAAPPNTPALPATLSMPAGEEIRVRINQWLSSDRNQPGDRFSGTLDQPIIANGWVVARRGQSISGQVTVAQKSTRGGVSQLGVVIDQITLVNGQSVGAKTEMVKGTPQQAPPGRNVGVVGTTTGVGAVVGGVVAGGAGAAIGAGLGATAGLIGVLSTHGYPTIIYPESVLTFRLDGAVQISTAGSEVAFQPLTQDDYGQQQGGPGQPQLVRRPPTPYPYPYAYYGAPYPYPYPYYGYYYPAPLAFGVYGGYGPGFYGRYRYFRR